jgi:hypothetical protein
MDILSPAETFGAVLAVERRGRTRAAAFRQVAADTGATTSAVQSRFYDEAKRRGGIPRRAVRPTRVRRRSRAPACTWSTSST